MRFRIISTGSKGNAVLYDYVLVDVGIPYSKLKPYVEQIKLVLLTHEHKDHFNLKSIRALSKTAKIVCCEWLSEKLGDIPHTVLEVNKTYDFGSVRVAAFHLYHDVKNCGWRIFMDGEKAFHATDTRTLDGITAKDYDIFAIEYNYDEITIYDVIDDKIKDRQYIYEYGAIESHLSFQKADQFIKDNAKATSKIYKLHMSGRYENE
jgi:phosphoribosyl 1,2-cyclic phosphodiesterase